jgi:hypothetical protein
MALKQALNPNEPSPKFPTLGDLRREVCVDSFLSWLDARYFLSGGCLDRCPSAIKLWIVTTSIAIVPTLLSKSVFSS